MQNFHFRFQGRQVGAIGTMGECVHEVEAETYEQAFASLYEKYEHISKLTSTVVDLEKFEIRDNRVFPKQL